MNNDANGCYSTATVPGDRTQLGLADGVGHAVVDATSTVVDTVDGTVSWVRNAARRRLSGHATTTATTAYERLARGHRSTTARTSPGAPTPGNRGAPVSSGTALDAVPARRRRTELPRRIRREHHDDLLGERQRVGHLVLHQLHRKRRPRGHCERRAATFTLDPITDFAGSETCTVTVFAAQVADQDSSDPPDNMAADFVLSFSTVAPPTRIHTIQGASHRSPLEGTLVSECAGHRDRQDEQRLLHPGPGTRRESGDF